MTGAYGNNTWNEGDDYDGGYAAPHKRQAFSTSIDQGSYEVSSTHYNTEGYMSKNKNRYMFYSGWIIAYCIFDFYIYYNKVLFGEYILPSAALSILIVTLLVLMLILCCDMSGPILRLLGIVLVIGALGLFGGAIYDLYIANDFLWQYGAWYLSLFILPGLLSILLGFDLTCQGGCLDNQAIRIILSALILVLYGGLSQAFYSPQWTTTEISIMLAVISFGCIDCFALFVMCLGCCAPNIVKCFAIFIIVASLAALVATILLGQQGKWGEFTWQSLFVGLYFNPILAVGISIGLILE